jgi:3D (Asp-Asp-Asp) domain-containing protein
MQRLKKYLYLNIHGALVYVLALLMGVSVLVSLPGDFTQTFPIAQERPLFSLTVPLSAYNSLPWQTDLDPCIAASGYDLCEANEENVVATNMVPLGYRIKIPELYGDKEFTVVDRMNSRYHYKVDLWMREYQDAIIFGNKVALVEVYK